MQFQGIPTSVDQLNKLWFTAVMQGGNKTRVDLGPLQDAISALQQAVAALQQGAGTQLFNATRDGIVQKSAISLAAGEIAFVDQTNTWQNLNSFVRAFVATLGYATTASLNNYVQVAALANYYTKGEVNTLFNSVYTKVQVDQLLNGYVTATQLDAYAKIADVILKPTGGTGTKFLTDDPAVPWKDIYAHVRERARINYMDFLPLFVATPTVTAKLGAQGFTAIAQLDPEKHLLYAGTGGAGWSSFAALCNEYNVASNQTIAELEDQIVATYYSRTDIDNRLAAYYTMVQIDAMLGNYVTLGALDARLQSYVSTTFLTNVLAVYAKVADLAAFYTQTQVNTLLQQYALKTDLNAYQYKATLDADVRGLGYIKLADVPVSSSLVCGFALTKDTSGVPTIRQITSTPYGYWRADDGWTMTISNGMMPIIFPAQFGVVFSRATTASQRAAFINVMTDYVQARWGLTAISAVFQEPNKTNVAINVVADGLRVQVSKPANATSINAVFDQYGGNVVVLAEKAGSPGVFEGDITSICASIRTNFDEITTAPAAPGCWVKARTYVNNLGPNISKQMLEISFFDMPDGLPVNASQAVEDVQLSISGRYMMNLYTLAGDGDTNDQSGFTSVVMANVIIK